MSCVSALAIKLDKRLLRPERFGDQLDIVELKCGTVLCQHLKNVGIRFKGEDSALGKGTLEIEHTEPDVGAAVDNPWLFVACFEPVNLLLNNGPVLGDKRLRIHQLKTAAQERGGTGGVARHACEPL